MVKHISLITALLFLSPNFVQAQAVKTGNQAVGICKAHIKHNVAGAERVKLSKVRTKRENHIAIFTVRGESGTSRTTCTINRTDGSISLSS